METNDIITIDQARVDAAIKKDGHFYAQYVGFNQRFDEMGHMCPYEYCIETQDLHPDGNHSNSCPTFGHDCPGGAWQAFCCRDVMAPDGNSCQC